MVKLNQSSYSVKLTDSDISAVLEAVKNEWGENRNRSINLLKESISNLVNKKYCLPISHGTAAITISLASLNLKPDDEIIIPNLTWVACVAPIIQLGLKPVFVNVDETLCLDPEEVKKSITAKTKVIFAVDLIGSFPKWLEIKKIAAENSLFLLEDAAESIGGSYRNIPAGAFGDVSILSFSPTKLVTGGQGGAICTDDENLWERFQSLYHHGINLGKTGKYFWSNEVGYNFQITNFQAALINSQINRIEEAIKMKANFYSLYSKCIEVSKYVTMYKFQKNIKSNFWMYLITPKNNYLVPKELVLERAAKYGLDLRPFFYLLSDMPVFSGFYNNINSYNRFLADYGVCLPYGYDLSEQKIVDIVRIIEIVYQELSYN
jgi:perosamine synthetase